MFERFTPDARTVVVHAQQQARRLGHHYIGCEHLLLAVVGIDQPAGEVMRERGVTPDHVEQQIVRRVGLGTGDDLFADLDRDALAAIGIDLDAVRARIEARFGGMPWTAPLGSAALGASAPGSIPAVPNGSASGGVIDGGAARHEPSGKKRNPRPPAPSRAGTSRLRHGRRKPWRSRCVKHGLSVMGTSVCSTSRSACSRWTTGRCRLFSGRLALRRRSCEPRYAIAIAKRADALISRSFQPRSGVAVGRARQFRRSAAELTSTAPSPDRGHRPRTSLLVPSGPRLSCQCRRT